MFVGTTLYELGDMHTIDQLVYQNKIVLDSFFIDFSKVRLRNSDEAVAVLEHESGIGVAPGGGLRVENRTRSIGRSSLCDSHDVQVVRPHMEEARGTQGDDWGADVTIGYHLYSEHIRNGASARSESTVRIAPS